MTFHITQPIRFGDCDPSGIAYFPSYLNILVGVMEEFFASLDYPWKRMIDENKIGTPTLKLDLMFLHPGFHGDQLDFTVDVKAIGRSSMDLHYSVSANGTLLWKADQKIVATDLETHKSTPWPDDLKQSLHNHLVKEVS